MTKESKFNYFIYHFISSVPRVIGRLYTYLHQWFLLLFNFEYMKVYVRNKRQWESISNIKDLVNYYDKTAIKRWINIDKNGVDKESCQLKFLLNPYNILDEGIFSFKKLKQFKFNPQRIIIKNKYNRKSLHIDSLFKYENKVILFNYGKLVDGLSIPKAIDKLNDKYNSFWGNTIYYWFYNRKLEYIGCFSTILFSLLCCFVSLILLK